MADKKTDKKMKDAEKKAGDHSLEVAEKGYDEDALTDDQKEALKHEEEFLKDSEKFQESDDPDDIKEQRQQV